MTEQQIIEPEARLLVELGQERGVLYEDELAALAQEIDLDTDDIQALRDELTGLGIEVVDPPAPEGRVGRGGGRPARSGGACGGGRRRDRDHQQPRSVPAPGGPLPAADEG